jgi:hypothetical protein
LATVFRGEKSVWEGRATHAASIVRDGEGRRRVEKRAAPESAHLGKG